MCVLQLCPLTAVPHVFVVPRWFECCLGTHKETECASALCSVTCVPCLLLFVFKIFKQQETKQRKNHYRELQFCFYNTTFIYVEHTFRQKEVLIMVESLNG